MNWQELYSFASKQALLGLCFEDIERLGEEYPENLPSIVFTTLSVPLTGDRNPSRNGKDVTALQCYICPTCPSPAGGSLTHSQALALSKRARDVTALQCCFFRSTPSLLSQGGLHILTKPSLLRREGCNRPPVLRTASL